VLEEEEGKAMKQQNSTLWRNVLGCWAHTVRWLPSDSRRPHCRPIYRPSGRPICRPICRPMDRAGPSAPARPIAESKRTRGQRPSDENLRTHAVRCIWYGPIWAVDRAGVRCTHRPPWADSIKGGRLPSSAQRGGGHGERPRAPASTLSRVFRVTASRCTHV
jgi:hypothetical protein